MEPLADVVTEEVLAKVVFDWNEVLVEALSRRWRLRSYPWAGSLSTAHTLSGVEPAWDRVAPRLRTVWPQLRPELLLDAAAKTGLGTRDYEIVKL